MKAAEQSKYRIGGSEIPLISLTSNQPISEEAISIPFSGEIPRTTGNPVYNRYMLQIIAGSKIKILRNIFGYHCPRLAAANGEPTTVIRAKPALRIM